MSKQSKFLRRVRALHASMGSANEGERNSAFARLNELLRREGKTWNDVPELLAPDAVHYDPDEPAEDGQGHYIPTMLGRDDPHPNPVDLVVEFLKGNVSLKLHQYVAASLWILHCHLIDCFDITPRLAALSPVNGCGKSRLMDIVEALVPRPLRADSLTAAAAYRAIDLDAPTLLVDEGDNLELHLQAKLRTVFNSGHQRGHKILISAPGDGVRSYDTFAPLMYAGIGSLPLPQLARSIALHMERSRVPLQTFSLRRNPETQRMMSAVFRYLFDWATTARPTIDLDPPMPTQLRNRVADNWRTLLTMADACGRGECARAAALEFNKGYHDEDAVVILLGDIRDIFNRLRTDILHSATLVAELLALEDGMIQWADWRGVRDNQQPRRLTPGELARLLQAFQIRPRSIWCRERREGATESSKKGYRREQFENAWARYCPEEDGTPAQRGFELCSF